MPEVHFIGTIDHAITDYETISMTWAIVPGSKGWHCSNGLTSGETQSCLNANEYSRAELNHPIDVTYTTSTVEGWPFFVCEVWDRTEEGVRGFIGCGSIWLPTSAGNHTIDIALWRPALSGMEQLVPSCPDLKSLRELMVSPYMRSQVQTDSAGTAKINVNIVSSGFEKVGVSL